MKTVDPTTYRRAADLIRTGGLAQGRFETEEGSHCIIGALRAVAGQQTFSMNLPDATVLLLADLLGFGDIRDKIVASWNIAAWNDEARRTPRDVIELLEQAAEKVEAEL